jgi:hypothetical protein
MGKLFQKRRPAAIYIVKLSAHDWNFQKPRSAYKSSAMTVLIPLCKNKWQGLDRAVSPSQPFPTICHSWLTSLYSKQRFASFLPSREQSHILGCASAF